MTMRRCPVFRLLPAAALLAAGCSSFEPQTFTSADEDVVTAPGVFSGEEGAFFVYGGPEGGLLGGAPEAAAVPAPAPEGGANPIVREEYETIIEPDGTRIERRIVIRQDGQRSSAVTGGTGTANAEARAIGNQPLPALP